MPRTFFCRTFGNTGYQGPSPSTDTAIHNQCLDAIVSVIVGLGLTGITGATPLLSSQVYKRKLPGDRNLTPPYVSVSLVPRPETVEEIVQSADDWGYPCLVAVVIASNQSLDIDNAELLWREQIRNAFHEKRPAEVVSGVRVPVKECVVEPGPILDIGLWKEQNLWVSGLTVRVKTRETR